MTSTWPRVTNLAAFYDVHHQSGQVSLNPNCPRTGGEGGALWLVSDPQSPQQHRGFYTTTSVPSAPPAALTHSALSALRPPAHNRQMIRRHEMPGGGIWSAGDQSDCSSITWCTLSRISERPFTHTHTRHRLVHVKQMHMQTTQAHLVAWSCSPSDPHLFWCLPQERR